MRLTFSEVEYILIHYGDYASGNWPDPKSSDNLCVQTSRLRAAFEAPCEIAAEIALRVRRCGLDGLLVEAMFMSGAMLTDDTIEKKYALPDTRYRVNRVILYCVEGRNEPYDNWRKRNRSNIWKKIKFL